MSESTEKRYLKWYNKIGYGSGDIAGNVVYAFLSSFVMIYLTNTVGLDPRHCRHIDCGFQTAGRRNRCLLWFPD